MAVESRGPPTINPRCASGNNTEAVNRLLSAVEFPEELAEPGDPGVVQGHAHHGSSHGARSNLEARRADVEWHV